MIKHIIKIFFFLPLIANAQPKIFFIAGLSFNIGSHLQRMGIAINSAIAYKYIQFSGRINYHYNFRAIGVPWRGNEIQINLATIYSFGNHYKLIDSINFFYLNNYTTGKFAIGYSFNIYKDQIGTSQNTGIISFQANNFIILTENDIFAQQASDKYRTAAVKLLWLTQKGNYGITTILWTANPKGIPRTIDSLYPSRWGYKDLTKTIYGQYSAGIFAFEYQKQFSRFNIGINSEWVRHILQNILIHDMYFIPKKLNKARNPHYPMLSDKGDAYLFRKGQKVKKTELFWQIGYNQSCFY